MDNRISLRKTNNEIYHNTKIKEYPNGYMRMTVASLPIYKESGYELVNPKERTLPPVYNKDALSRSDSIHRAKEAVHDIVALNEWEYFVTLTLDPKLIDCKDTQAIKTKFRAWLSNMRQRYSMSYLAVPEFHKSGAIHFHLLISGNVRLEESKTVIHSAFSKPVRLETLKKKGLSAEDCKTVYNLPSWTLGHSTAIRVYGDRKNLAKYITKYLCKDFKKIFGKFYYAGGDIKRKPPVTLVDSDFDSLDRKEYLCKQTGVSFKYDEVSGGLLNE